MIFQFRCKCLNNLLGLAPENGGGTPKEGARLPVMTNEKSKWIIG